MKLSVQCYSGRKPDERPVRFWLEGKQYEVEARARSVVRPRWHLLQGSSQRRECLYYSTTNVAARGNVGFGFISPNECGALTRFAGHRTQGSMRIRIHLLPSERWERHRGRQAGQDSAAEIRPRMARRLP